MKRSDSSIARHLRALILAAALLSAAGETRAQVSGQYVILVNNDLGMHCMNKDHATL
jgi:hypothetical protein